MRMYQFDVMVSHFRPMPKATARGQIRSVPLATMILSRRLRGCFGMTSNGYVCQEASALGAAMEHPVKEDVPPVDVEHLKALDALLRDPSWHPAAIPLGRETMPVDIQLQAHAATQAMVSRAPTRQDQPA